MSEQFLANRPEQPARYAASPPSTHDDKTSMPGLLCQKWCGMSLGRNDLNDNRRVAGHCVPDNGLQRLLGSRRTVLAIDGLVDINMGDTIGGGNAVQVVRAKSSASCRPASTTAHRRARKLYSEPSTPTTIRRIDVIPPRLESKYSGSCSASLAAVD